MTGWRGEAVIVPARPSLQIVELEILGALTVMWAFRIRDIAVTETSPTPRL